MVKCISGFINEIAFPAPEEDEEFYEETLLKRKDLVWLYTQPPGCFGKPEKIPALHIKYGRSITAPYTILYSHGNAEDLGFDVDYLLQLSKFTEVDIFAYEYVGYSLSRIQENAKPSPAGCKRSIEAAWRYLVEEAKIPPEKIILYGRSIGSGPTLHLASKRAVKGAKASPQDAGSILLQSPVESGFRAAFTGRTAARLSLWCGCFDIFKNYRKIHRVGAPVGIIHGIEDEVVPHDNGKALHSKLKEDVHEPLWLEGHGHNDIPPEVVVAYAKRLISSLRNLSGEQHSEEATAEEKRKARLEAIQRNREQALQKVSSE